jgi:hypothetical protein
MSPSFRCSKGAMHQRRGKNILVLTDFSQVVVHATKVAGNAPNLKRMRCVSIKRSAILLGAQKTNNNMERIQIDALQVEGGKN